MMRKLQKPIHLAILALVLLACQITTPRTTRAPLQPDTGTTESALVVQTEVARLSFTRTPTMPPTATITPTPSATPTITPTLAQSLTPTSAFQVTPRPDLLLLTHPEIPDYVFQIDPSLWEQDKNGTWNFIHKNIAGCEVKSVPGHGIPPPERLFWKDLGRFHWMILDYGNWAYAVNNSGSFLQLERFNNAACWSDQEDILANVMTIAESKGEIGFVPVKSPTPRPALEGFECPNTPPARLRVGDKVSVMTDGLWLRSEPRVDVSTRLRQYRRFPPIEVSVTGGPVCEKYVFWQVKVTAIGKQPAEEIEGWLAEGDLQEYYLQPAW